MRILILGIFLLGSANLWAKNVSVKNFAQAKKELANIYKDGSELHGVSFYCGCQYTTAQKTIDPKACGYLPQTKSARARKLEWEHVVPAQAFGQSFKEWREGHPDCVHGKTKKPFKGRKCAQKTNPEFAQMEADLYNLFPAEGELNGKRGHRSMAMIPGEKREFGACDFELGDNKIEPRDAIQGDIARVYMYMDQTYPGRGIVSDKNKKLFEAWDKLDPIDSNECARSHAIEKIQGGGNPIVQDRCRGLAESVSRVQ